MSLAMTGPDKPVNLAAQRLKRARERANYATAADFARAHGINEVTYQHHENGNRRLTLQAARTYERLLNLPQSSLLYGDSLPGPDPVPIVGSVSAAGKIVNFSTECPEHLDGPFRARDGYVAYRITTNELAPTYRAGMFVLIKPLGTQRYRLRDLDGYDCIVELATGEILLRQIIAQGDQTAALIGPGNMTTLHQTIVHVSPIEHVSRPVPHHIED